MAILVSIYHRYTNQECTIKLEPNVQVRDLIPRIAAKFDTRGDYFVLKHNGRILRAEDTLDAAGVANGAKLELVVLPFKPPLISELDNFLRLMQWFIEEVQGTLERYERSIGVPVSDAERADFFYEMQERIHLTKVTSDWFAGRKCPECSQLLKVNDRIVVCIRCGLAMHESCWEKAGRCWVCEESQYYEAPEFR